MQRKSKFALDDEDDDQATEVLTHGGTALSTLDDFQDDISADEDDDAGRKVFVRLISLLLTCPSIFCTHWPVVVLKMVTIFLHRLLEGVNLVYSLVSSGCRHCKGPALWWWGWEVGRWRGRC
jgi:hypothetical protein